MLGADTLQPVNGHQIGRGLICSAVSNSADLLCPRARAACLDQAAACWSPGALGEPSHMEALGW